MAQQTKFSFMTLVRKTGTSSEVSTASALPGSPWRRTRASKPKVLKTDRRVWTSIRYGQVAIPIEDTRTSHWPVESVPMFYEAVGRAIEAGELDAQFGKLQTERSAALEGKNASQPVVVAKAA